MKQKVLATQKGDKISLKEDVVQEVFAKKKKRGVCHQAYRLISSETLSKKKHKTASVYREIQQTTTFMLREK